MGGDSAHPRHPALTHLEDNLGALSVRLSPAELGALGQAIRTLPVAGERYTAEGMKGVNA
ncbi:hypothetical protein [Aeromonas caviae]|uniref:hypothetical protein n=1 Tax=Aeromonas caviae TaxID=648 RepID=UPI002B46D8A2|nr:hypothetical protein [Aeromonas caviae]